MKSPMTSCQDRVLRIHVLLLLPPSLPTYLPTTHLGYTKQRLGEQ